MLKSGIGFRKFSERFCHFFSFHISKYASNCHLVGRTNRLRHDEKLLYSYAWGNGERDRNSFASKTSSDSEAYNSGDSRVKWR